MLLVAWSAHARDKDGAFAVKGVGSLTCREFVTQHGQRGARLSNYVGWIDGFMTGINQHTPETFDLAPWQGGSLLAYAVAGYCRRAPEESFYKAVRGLAQTLYTNRLTDASDVLVASTADAQVFVYATVLTDVRSALIEMGHLAQPIDGAFDNETAAALRRFQRSKGLPESGLPDQQTLVEIYRQP
ncbi:MAG: peptidoglycan-binding protein [Pseudomonadota bacterium]